MWQLREMLAPLGGLGEAFVRPFSIWTQRWIAFHPSRPNIFISTKKCIIYHRALEPAGDTMDRIREILLYVAAAFAIFSIICAVFQAMNDRLGSAGVLAALFVACTMIVFLPQLEVFKAFGIEARLAKTLDRAEEILGRLRTLSEISARVSYLTMAWSNRWGQPSVKEKKAVLDGIDKQLEDIKVSPEERKSLARPLVRMVGVDLYNIYVQVLDRYLGFRNRDLQTKPEKTPEEITLLDEAERQTSEWRRRSIGHGPYEKFDTYDFAKELENASPASWLDAKKHAAANKFKQELIDLFQGCEMRGGFTEEYANYYDRYATVEGADLKIKELFDMDVSKLK
jgi:hypothetical protein